MSEDAIIEVESLSHRYGDRLALEALTFEVPSGAMVALLGPNGSGKSTLFKILTTLLRPTAGTARIAGADVVTQGWAVRGLIGVVFQNPSLDGKLTALENLRHQGHLYGLAGRTLTRRAMDLLERFAVADRAGDRVDVLSGGLQRRVDLAKALLHEPRVLILDEPSTGLDPGARAILMDHITDLCRRDGVTALFTTHLTEEAERGDRVAILDEGRLVAMETPDALKRTVGGDVLTVATADPHALSQRVAERFGVALQVVDGVVRIERDRGHEFVPELIEAFPGEIESVTVGKPTLGDVFVHHTGHRLWEDGNLSSHGDRGKN